MMGSDDNIAQAGVGQRVFVAGTGNSAAITALALKMAGCAVVIEGGHKHPPPNITPDRHDKSTDWQRVLALGAASKTMLQRLGIWARLDLPTAAITDMQIIGAPDFGGLYFGADFDETNFDTKKQAGPKTETETLAHSVSLNALSRAIAQTLADKLADTGDTGSITRTTSPFADWRNQQLYLDNGTQMRGAVLVDTNVGAHTVGGKTIKTREAAGIAIWQHDYHASALVAVLDSTYTHKTPPHKTIARQVFLPSGPLALLPLPHPQKLALIWSLPTPRASALAQVAQDIFEHELNKACLGFGDIETLSLSGQRTTQPLYAHFANHFVAPNLVLLGAAAHLFHPLAGQGFNVTLRDASALADTFYDARMLGLSLADPWVLQKYQTLRRGDTAIMASTTHALAQLFFTAPKLATAGLATMGALVKRQPNLAKFLRTQANNGSITAPRLMRPMHQTQQRQFGDAPIL